MEHLVAVPLFRQIATRIRHRIASGDLKKGDGLPSLRSGAEEWGVNLHTVRRAYASLEEEGLVETRPCRGTRVAARGGSGPSPGSNDLDAFARWVARAAAQRFGVDASQLAARIVAVGEARDPVWVLECSRSLAADLAAQIRAWDESLDARPWLVQRAAETPPGRILATYYHYAEVRDALEGLDRSPRFFRVEIDPEKLGRVRQAARPSGRMVLIAAHAESGGALAEELQALLGDDGVSVDLRVARNLSRELADIPDGIPALLTPECWDALDERARASAAVFPLRLRPEAGHLTELLVSV